MEIRRARHEDMGPIIDYMETYHTKSNLSDVKFDRQSCVKIVDYYISHKDSLPLVAVKDGKIDGLLFGSLEPFFFNRKKTYATDLMFISGGYGRGLWLKFKDWAFESGADRILMGVSSGDDRAGHLLEALGMKQLGGMYELRSQGS